MQYTIIPTDGAFQVYNTVSKSIHSVYTEENIAQQICLGLNKTTRYTVLSNVNLFIVWDTQTAKCHSSGYVDKQTAESVCAILNGSLTLLETELLAHVRSMSAKLYEAADIWEMHVKNFPEPAAMFRCNAEYSFYLKQFPVMEQFGYK